MRRVDFRLVASSLIWFAGIAAGAEMALADFPEVANLPVRPDLPDPLVRLDGSRVTTAEQWVTQRRPELKALFQHYMYGTLPPVPVSMTSRTESEDRNYWGGKATKREITIAFGPPYPPKIHLLLIVPNHPKRPPPVFLGLNFNGNHTALDDPTIALPEVWMPASAPGVIDHKANRRRPRQRIGRLVNRQGDRPRLCPGHFLQR